MRQPRKTIIRPELRLPKNGVESINTPSSLKISVAAVASQSVMYRLFIARYVK
jgi:hypothetical protein